MAKSKMFAIDGTVYNAHYFRRKPGHCCLSAEVYTTSYVVNADTGEFEHPGPGTGVTFRSTFVGTFIRNTAAINADGTPNRAFRKVRRCWAPPAAGSFHGPAGTDVGKVETDREAIIMLAHATRIRELAGMTV